MFMLQVDWYVLFDLGDVNWRQAETRDLLIAEAVDVLMLKSERI